MSDPAEDGQAIQLLVRPDPTELTSVAPPTQTFRTLTDLGSRLTELLSSLKPDPHTQKTISRMAWTLAPPAWVWSVSLHPDTGLLEIAALTLVSAGLSAAVCSQMQHALRTGDPTHLRNVQCGRCGVSRARGRRRDLHLEGSV